jgi:hypothetical protein
MEKWMTGLLWVGDGSGVGEGEGERYGRGKIENLKKEIWKGGKTRYVV